MSQVAARYSHPVTQVAGPCVLCLPSFLSPSRPSLSPTPHLHLPSIHLHLHLHLLNNIKPLSLSLSTSYIPLPLIPQHLLRHHLPSSQPPPSHPLFHPVRWFSGIWIPASGATSPASPEHRRRSSLDQTIITAAHQLRRQPNSRCISSTSCCWLHRTLVHPAAVSSPPGNCETHRSARFKGRRSKSRSKHARAIRIPGYLGTSLSSDSSLDPTSQPAAQAATTPSLFAPRPAKTHTYSQIQPSQTQSRRRSSLFPAVSLAVSASYGSLAAFASLLIPRVVRQPTRLATLPPWPNFGPPPAHSAALSPWFVSSGLVPTTTGRAHHHHRHHCHHLHHRRHPSASIIMPYNTRRVSLSLPMLGIALPSSSRSAPHRTPPTSASSAAAATPSDQPPSKKAKRMHRSSSPTPPSPPQKSTATTRYRQEPARPSAHVAENTPPPSPGGAGFSKIDTEGIDDDVVVGAIDQLERTGNRPHSAKELAAVLSNTLAVVER